MQLFNATYSFFMFSLGFIEKSRFGFVRFAITSHTFPEYNKTITDCVHWLEVTLHTGKAAHQLKDFIVPNPEMQILRFASESPKKAP